MNSPAELLETLSESLEKEYGSGFSVTALKYMRMLYLGYPKLLEIGRAVRDESASASAEAKGHTVVLNLAITEKFIEKLRISV